MKLTIFQFWNAPINQAPPLVRSCISSWVSGCREAGLDHVLIDSESLPEWERKIGGVRGEMLRKFRLEVDCWPDAKWRRYSDLLRLALLSKFNGIWADSTILLMKPIHSWLPEKDESSGLVLCRSGGDGMIENWFLCSIVKNELLEAWTDEVFRYNLEVHQDAHQFNYSRFSLTGLLHKLGSYVPKARRLWLIGPMRKWHKRAPYFVNYYIFEEVFAKRCGKDLLYRLFLPFDWVSWAYFNSNQGWQWRIDEIDKVLLKNLLGLPFIKLCWKRSPPLELMDLDDDLVLKFLWEESINK